MKLSLKMFTCVIFLGNSPILLAQGPDCLKVEEVQRILRGDNNPFKEFQKLGWTLEAFTNIEPSKAPIQVTSINKIFDHKLFDNIISRDCSYSLIPEVGGQFGSVNDGEIKLNFSVAK